MSTANEILSRMAEANNRLRALPPIQTCMHMHPDDINEVRAMFGQRPVGTSPYNNLFGVKIIPDENAERLPRIETVAQKKGSV